MQGRRRKETADYFSKGITAIIFVLLLVQFGFFAFAILRRNGHFFEPEVIVIRDTVHVYHRRSSVSPTGTAAKMVSKTAPRPAPKPASTPLPQSPSINGTASVYGVAPALTAPVRPARKLTDLNTADSLELLDLYGIGPYYAHRILDYRKRLGGFAAKEQLMEIHGIDQERFDGLADRVHAHPSGIRRFSLYDCELERLQRHPYIGFYATKGIARMRKMVKREELTLELLIENGILTARQGDMLEDYVE